MKEYFSETCRKAR